MNYRSANSLCEILCITGLVTTLCLFLFETVNFWFYVIAVVGLLLVITGGVIKVIFYRCPHCHGLLPMRTMAIPKYCPECGKKLD